MPVKELAVKELVEAVEVSTKTFKSAPVQTKEYHYMQKIVGPMALPDGTITSDMLDAEVSYWLNAGFSLKFAGWIGDSKGQGGEFLGRVVEYHFVKE